ncbi:MAG: hypothetical protein ACR2JB_15545 [Bryobacteraceae bacterium]
MAVIPLHLPYKRQYQSSKIGFRPGIEGCPPKSRDPAIDPKALDRAGGTIARAAELLWRQTVYAASIVS